MRPLDRGPEPRSDRPAGAILYDDANIRIVSFHLVPGQTLPPHRNPSTVTVLVTEGSGTFSGEDAEVFLRVGEGAVYAPNEMHSVTAGEEPLRFAVFIAPRPG